MKAVVIRWHGGIDRLRLEDIPTPRPGGGQMLVRVRAVALNNLDIWARSGPPGGRPVYPWGRPRLPLITGGDVAGVVEAVGSGVPGLAAGGRGGADTHSPRGQRGPRLARGQRKGPRIRRIRESISR